MMHMALFASMIAGIPSKSLAFALVGAGCIYVIFHCLWTGRTWSADGPGVTRAEEPVEFYGQIFFLALLAAIFIGVAIAFYSYPNAAQPMVRDELPAGW